MKGKASMHKKNECHEFCESCGGCLECKAEDICPVDNFFHDKVLPEKPAPSELKPVGGVLLFDNTNLAVFDDSGQQIAELQINF